MTKSEIGRRIPKLADRFLFDVSNDVVVIIAAGGDVTIAVHLSRLVDGNALVKPKAATVVRVIAVEVFRSRNVREKNNRR